MFSKAGVTFLVLSALLFTSLTHFNVNVSAGPNVINVPKDFSTIQEAIDAADLGDTILVSAGIYDENVRVNKTVALIGEDRSRTIIDGGGNGTVVSVKAEAAKITGFTIQNSGWPYFGISVFSSSGNNISGNNISGNIVTNCYMGIRLHSTVLSNITGNHVANNDFGIFIWDSCTNNIARNIAINNNSTGIALIFYSYYNNVTENVATNNGDGIHLWASGYNTLKHNNMSSNRYNFCVDGWWFSDFINDVDASNMVDGKPIYYLINQRNLIVDSYTFPNIGYLGVVNSTDILIKNLTLMKNGDGVLLAYSTNSSIKNMTLISNSMGIHLSGSVNNTVSGNTIFNCWLGFHLSKSADNIVNANNVINNSEGILMEWSQNNTIFHNNFINNIRQVWLKEKPYNNIWDNDYPSGGNYWSDYVGVDFYSGSTQNETGSDGIGDTPYVLDADNQDNYPLMKPYSGPYDIGITNVKTYKTVVGQGYNLSVNVKIINYGINTETFNITTVYANMSNIQTKAITLTSRNSTTITFTWNTTGFAKGNYTITAKATPVSGETDTTDNTLTDGRVIVTIPGDVDADGDIDIYDVVMVTSVYGSKQGEPLYNPNVDINDDRIINMYDVVIATSRYGEKDP